MMDGEDIVSLVSSPSYAPNAFVHGVGQDYWNSLINNKRKPLTNKAVSGLYPPGSTIKTIVALSALENKIIRPLDTVRCKGKIELFGEKFHCWKKKGHGVMNMRTGIKRSCDVYFYEVARKLGVDRLSVTLEKFGFGNKVLNTLLSLLISVPNLLKILDSKSKGLITFPHQSILSKAIIPFFLTNCIALL